MHHLRDVRPQTPLHRPGYARLVQENLEGALPAHLQPVLAIAGVVHRTASETEPIVTAELRADPEEPLRGGECAAVPEGEGALR